MINAMNLDRLNKLNDLLDEADSRIENHQENIEAWIKFLSTIKHYATWVDEEKKLRKAYNDLEITKAAKRRILQAIRQEMNILRTQLQIEIEHEKAN